MKNFRTDMAREAFLQLGDSLPDGAAHSETEENGFKTSCVEITSDEAAEKLCKPIGKYVTVDIQPVTRREVDAFTRGAGAIAKVIRELLAPAEGETVLVAGLGNAAVTPDAVGPRASRHVMVTRHLVETLPEYFGAFRPVAALETGVLATTGIESAELIRAACDKASPARIIVVDALASREVSALCKTVQITDAGIAPGSGVGNARAEISERTLGVPVVAVGVPTVVDISGSGVFEGDSPLIVTPSDIDAHVSDLSRLIGYGINLALHTGLTVADIDMFLG